MFYHSWASSQVSFLWIEMDGHFHSSVTSPSYLFCRQDILYVKDFVTGLVLTLPFWKPVEDLPTAKALEQKGWRLCIGTSPTSSHSASCITVILGNGTCRQFVEGNPLPLQQPGLFGDFHGTPLVNSSIEWSTAQLNVIQSWFWRTCFATGDVQLYLCHPIIRRLH